MSNSSASTSFTKSRALQLSHLLVFLIGVLICIIWTDGGGKSDECAKEIEHELSMRSNLSVLMHCRSLPTRDDEDDELYLPLAELNAKTAALVAKLKSRETIRESWVFLLDFDDAEQHYTYSVLAHIRAIRSWSHVKRRIVVLVNENMRESHIRNQLAVDDDVLIQTFEPIAFDKRRLLVLKNVNRVHVWSLVDYDKVVFVANEVALFSNLEHLFEYRSPTFTPNLEVPTQLRTALFVATPDADVFDEMLAHLDTYSPTFDTSDQAFFDSHFNAQYALLPWNACPSVRTMYLRKDLWDWRDVTCLHWSQFKPWLWQQRHDLRALTHRWYEYMERHAGYTAKPGDVEYTTTNAV